MSSYSLLMAILEDVLYLSLLFVNTYIIYYNKSSCIYYYNYYNI